MDWSGEAVLRKHSTQHWDTKGACMLDEHHLLLSIWGTGLEKLDLRTMKKSATPVNLDDKV